MSRNESNFNLKPICLQDFEKLAQKSLSKDAENLVTGGADEEVTLRDNMEAFKRIRLRPRVLHGISTVDTSTTVLGHKISMPICAAPAGFHTTAHPDGEKATARACSRAGILMALSMYSSTSIEEVAKASPDVLRWLQLYILKDKDHMRKIIKTAEQEGYTAFLITVDAIETGNRRSTADPDFWTKLSAPIVYKELVEGGIDDVLDRDITWDIISWVKSITRLPVIVKGIHIAEDAKLAVQHGADAIVVSNHGGRQLDGVLATVDALQEVISAVNGQVEVYLDGGVRLGTDVLKALALGARAVFIGRPLFWGLAYQGEEGVYQVLEILREELRKSMILAGCSSVKDIPRDLVVTKHYQSHL